MSQNPLQSSFFKQIKQKLPAYVPLVEVVASHLHLSHDSAYRRIRGDKALTIDELQQLSAFYKISVDKFFGNENGTERLLFSGKFIPRNDGNIEDFLMGLIEQLTYFNSFSRQTILYMNKDIPIFHHFMFPELAAFKCYFWSRYNLNYTRFNKGQFVLANYIDQYRDLSKKISDLYITLPATEIWNLDSISLTIRQINYFDEANIFASPDDALIIRQSLSKLIDHIEDQVENGVKSDYRDKTKGTKNGIKYTMFINEFSIGDNTVYLELDDLKMVSINHNVLNYIMTTDKAFVDYTYETIMHLLKKSTLISEVGEKQRRLFFDTLRNRINRVVNVLV